MASPGRAFTQPGLSLPDKRTRKPNSVLCGHSSRRRVAADVHQRPTRRFRPLHGAAFRRRAGTEHEPCSLAHASLPIWSCSVWGLPCLRHYCRSGALLPHLFTLTIAWSSLLDQIPRISQDAFPKGCSMQWRYVFCGTGRPRALTPASRTLSGTLPSGVRTFLSRKPLLAQRLTAATARSPCQVIVYSENDPSVARSPLRVPYTTEDA